MTEQNAREAMEVWREAKQAWDIARFGDHNTSAASVIAAKLAEKDAEHEATKAELQTTKAMMQDYALDKEEAEAELQALREALEPFQTFAECHIDEEGWTGPMKTTRIVDWFGPSDFRALTRKDA